MTQSQQPTEPVVEMLTEDERLRVLRAAMQGQQRSLTVDEAERFLQWAVEARVNAYLLQMVLDGTTLLALDAQGEVLAQAARARYDDDHAR